MSAIRRRRLQADHERIKQAFAAHGQIRVLKTQGSPPDRYQIEYRLKGLALNGDRVIKKDRYVAEIYLTTGYPRQAPQCRMLTPCFHPNVDTNAICVGDHWAAGESLANLIVRIGEIITYQTYNTKSPLNGEAARWVDENGHLLPVDSADLRPESLATAEAAAITVKAEKPKVAKGKIVRRNGRKPATGAIPKGRLIRHGGGEQRPPKAKVLRAKKVAPTGRPAGRTKPASKGAIVVCPCGRKYRPKRASAFRCLACGTRLQPPG